MRSFIVKSSMTFSMKYSLTVKMSFCSYNVTEQHFAVAILDAHLVSHALCNCIRHDTFAVSAACTNYLHACMRSEREMTNFPSNSVKLWKQPPVSPALVPPTAFYVFISLLCCVQIPVRMFHFRFHHFSPVQRYRAANPPPVLFDKGLPIYVCFVATSLSLSLSASFPTPFSGPIFIL